MTPPSSSPLLHPRRRLLRTRLAAVASLPVGTAVSVLLAAATATPIQAATGLESLRLNAHPAVIRADGRSTTIISAQVYDERGNPIADGTRVRFTTTAGRLDASVVATQGGVARVTLTAADQPGEAQVVAVLETPGQAVPANLTITFTADADAAEVGTAWAQIEGKSVGYILNGQTIQASGKDGGARLTFRGLTLTADTFQFNVRDNTLKAVGHVTLAQGNTSRSYRNLTWNLLTNFGLGERIEEDGLPHIYAVKAPRLEEIAPPPEMGYIGRETWELADLSGANVVVTARSLALEPNRRLQLRRATFWLDGKKTATLPFHVLDLEQGTLFQDQIVGYGPAGISFDLPFYYDVRPSSVGTLHMRRGANVGSSVYSARPVWTLDMVQSYNGANEAQGVLELNGITRSDRGARLRHAQRLDSNTTGNFLFDLPNSQSLYLNSQISRNYKTFHVDLIGSGTRAGGVYDPVSQKTGAAGGDIRGQISAETYARPLWGVRPISYRFNIGAARQGFYGGNTAVSQGVITTQTAGLSLDTIPLAVARSTKYRQSFQLGQTWVRASKTSASALGISLRGTSALDRSLGKLGSTSLTYDYTQAPSLSGVGGYYGGLASAGATARHRLGLSAYLTGGAPWTLRLTGSRGLDLDQATLLGDLRVAISGPWSAGVSLSATRLSGYTYKEMQYAVTRRISGKDYTLSYSTTAKRFFFNFGGFGF